jgi:hypothetical protein
MRRPRAEEILGEWGVRDVTPPSQAERERLERHRELGPPPGTAIRRRYAAARAEPDRYLAALGGPLPYMRRLRLIEQETETQLELLAEARRSFRGDAAGWRAHVASWDFGELNELIERHNRFYPIEARLAMDPRTRDFVKIGGRSYRKRPLDLDWVLEHFPA